MFSSALEIYRYFLRPNPRLTPQTLSPGTQSHVCNARSTYTTEAGAKHLRQTVHEILGGARKETEVRETANVPQYRNCAA